MVAAPGGRGPGVRWDRGRVAGLTASPGDHTGGATKQPRSGSLKDSLATSSFMGFAVPHWSGDLGPGEVVDVGVQVSSSRHSSSVVYWTVLPCGRGSTGEGVVARHVPAGTPDLLEPGAHDAAGPRMYSSRPRISKEMWCREVCGPLASAME